MEYPQAIVSIIMLCVCVLLGLPVWWNTTKVYRAPLPHARITELQNITVSMNLKIQVFADDSVWFLMENIGDVLGIYKHIQFDVQRFGIEHLDHGYGNSVDESSYCEQLQKFEKHNSMIYNVYPVITDAESFRYFCPSGFSYVLRANKSEIRETMVSLFRTILPLTQVSNLESRLKRNVDVTNSLPLSPGYEIAFTLAVAEPTAKLIPRWDIEETIDSILKPVLAKLHFLGPFKVSSQVLYYTDVGVVPHKVNDDGNETAYYYYSKAKLPLIMNPLETRLNTYTSTDAGLNFIIYIPPAKHTPLFFKSKKAGLNNAFHSPRWGGIQIHNLIETTSGNGNERIETESYMKTFTLQLLTLNGLDANENARYFARNERQLLTKPMRTRLMVLKVFEHLKTSILTLSSLSKLLDEIANIVIRDEIKELIETSVRNIDQALESIDGGDIESAMRFSKVAFESSEKAFYDWSLLALLYFPDDQKYAIYVPLFLPISLPVFLSFFNAVKFLRGKK